MHLPVLALFWGSSQALFMGWAPLVILTGLWHILFAVDFWWIGLPTRVPLLDNVPLGHSTHLDFAYSLCIPSDLPRHPAPCIAALNNLVFAATRSQVRAGHLHRAEHFHQIDWYIFAPSTTGVQRNEGSVIDMDDGEVGAQVAYGQSSSGYGRHCGGGHG